jgi:hypothetical protein
VFDTVFHPLPARVPPASCPYSTCLPARFPPASCPCHPAFCLHPSRILPAFVLRLSTAENFFPLFSKKRLLWQDISFSSAKTPVITKRLTSNDAQKTPICLNEKPPSSFSNLPATHPVMRVVGLACLHSPLTRFVRHFVHFFHW